MELVLAKTSDFERIRDFYKYVIEDTPNMEKYCLWVYGQHPSDNMLQTYIDGKSLFYIEENGKIVAAVAVTWQQGEEYHSVEWSNALKDDEVAVIHILCVDPKKQKCGFAKDVMKLIFKVCEEKKAVRLDAIHCNLPAQKLYESLGFRKCGVKNMFAQNVGWIDFILYEYNF